MAADRESAAAPRRCLREAEGDQPNPHSGTLPGEVAHLAPLPRLAPAGATATGLCNRLPGAQNSFSAIGSGATSPCPPSDTTAPVVVPTISGTLGANGWYVSNVTVTWSVTDPESAVTSTPGCGPTTISSDTTGTTLTCTATSAGGTTSVPVTIKRDATPPTITYLGQNPAPNANGWNNTAVTLSWSCTDATSGPVSATVSQTISTEGANQSATGTCTDTAGNTASDPQGGIDIDLTAPTDLTWIGGPDDGGAYYFGFVPAEPTCTATDALSGLAGCVVTGYGTTVGSHTLTATATDKADNVATAARTYTVLAWETYGFYRPVDPVPVVNTVKAGSTVPLKFEVFAGALELTDTAIVDTLTYRQVACNAFEDMTESPVELTATGGTVLRYDWTAGQFIFNWKTPATPSKCYKTTLLLDDGSTISAYFKLK